MAKVRLLEIRNTYKWGGGPDKTILLSAEQHDKTRVTPVVAYIRDVRDAEFQITERARAKGLTFHEIPERGKFDPSVIGALRKLIVQYDINLIHSHDYKSDLFAYLAGRWFAPKPVRLMSTAHAWVLLGLKGEIYRRLDLLVMRHFDRLVAVSEATQREMVAGGVPAEKIAIIHNAIDTVAWSPARVDGSCRKAQALEAAFPIIGYVGRINEEKDLETWIRAAAVVGAKYPKARFVLVGDGKGDDTQARIEQLAATLNIRQQIVFTGFRSDLQELYGSFDIFMLTSRREGLPNCILEAMAMGVPVVTTDVAGAKELVADQMTGFVLPQGDVEGLGGALMKLASDRELCRRFGAASRMRIEEKFSFSQRLRRIEDLYESIVGVPQGGVRPSPSAAERSEHGG